jgi:ATP-dependent phosphofructokinase / diphosphate-dependent phosphofructokinase
MRIGILTGGGDCPGLNAVIRAVVRKGEGYYGHNIVGYRGGWRGPIEGDSFDLSIGNVRGLLPRGGTILGTSRTNPYKTEGGAQKVKQTLASDNIGALIAVGGEDTLGVAHRLWQEGVNVVGVPKTIDNDLSATDFTFGFHTAVQIATELIDRLHTTAESHDRVMVVEVMGRYAGWIALYSGLSGSADVILIPEIPFDIDKVCEKIQSREAAGRHFSIVVVAEGARPKDGAIELLERRRPGTSDRLGGIASKVARAIEHHTGKEIRTLVLGHLQRGGSPTTYDRLLALRFGSAAVRAIADGAFGTMLGLNGQDITRVPLEHVVGRAKNVPLDSDTIRTARDLGISLGD